MGCPTCGADTAKIPNGLGGTTAYCVMCGPSNYPRFLEVPRHEPPQRPGHTSQTSEQVKTLASYMPPLFAVVAEEPDDGRQATEKLDLLREILERVGEWWPEQRERISDEITRVFKQSSLAQLAEFSDILAERPARHPLELLAGWQAKMKAEKSKTEEVK